MLMMHPPDESQPKNTMGCSNLHHAFPQGNVPIRDSRMIVEDSSVSSSSSAGLIRAADYRSRPPFLRHPQGSPCDSSDGWFTTQSVFHDTSTPLCSNIL